MGLVYVFEVKGMTARHYDDVIAALEAKGLGTPAGRITHVAAPSQDGWIVVDTWASEATFAAFGEVLGPLLGQRGLAPQIRAYPIHAQAVAAREAEVGRV